MNEQSLKKLESILKLIDEGVRKDDFEKFVKQILELLVKMEKRNSEAIAGMEKTHAEMIKQISNTHNESYKALRGQVNDVFVGDAIKRMEGEHKTRLASIRNGKDGITPTKEELIALIKPLIPLPKEGRPGRSENLTDIRQDIKELKEDMKKQKSRIFAGGTIGKDAFQDIDISSQFDGSTKTFNIRAVWRIISVDLSSFPYGSLRKTTDYTWTPTTITFTSAIDATTQLAAGQSCIITAIV